MWPSEKGFPSLKDLGFLPHFSPLYLGWESDHKLPVSSKPLLVDFGTWLDDFLIYDLARCMRSKQSYCFLTMMRVVLCLSAALLLVLSGP